MQLLKEFNLEELKEDGIIPLKKEEKKLYVLTYEILKNTTICKYKKMFNLKLIPFYIGLSFYESKFKEMESRLKNCKRQNVEEFKEGNLLLKDTLDKAILKRASDIHLEPSKDFVQIRFRIDGVIVKYTRILKSNYEELLSIVKVKSNMDISKKFIPQDGNMTYTYENSQYNLRISTMPNIYGEKLVIRILNPQKEIKLQDLGFHMQIDKFQKILNKNSGIVLSAGPTGSGKSTTLKALINSMKKHEKNIVTIEDPVEYRLEEVTQIALNEKAGLNFSTALKSILRQDPDVIMVGEIRDEETAQIALRAAITGHLVLSTVHTYDSTSVITRLLDMNIPAYIILDTVSMILSQRLVRKICPYCKHEYYVQEKVYEDLGLKSGTKLYRGIGCDYCHNTGYIGRTVTYEILELREEHKKYISNNKDLSGFRSFCMDNGLISIKEYSLRLLLQGITTLEEIYKVIL
ncbi:GspE/PulE family protein [Hathewaya histolytica]|uniref:GspE/PulE family protein n=1 Tax=Hathewaya histolytica TaxID=1498 RepID=UPI003B67E21B